MIENEYLILRNKNSYCKYLLLELKKRLLLWCIHNFKSALINDMDHGRISGTEPLSVILSQRKEWKLIF